MKEKHTILAPPLTTFPFREAKGIARIHNSRTTCSSSETRSSSSSSSSASVTHFCSKPKSLSKIQDKLLAVSSKSGINPFRSKASKENDLPTATSRKLQNKNHSNPVLCRQKSGKTPTTTSKPVSRSQLSSTHISDSLKESSSGTQGYRVNSKDLKHLNNKNGSNIPIVIHEIFKKPAEILNGDDKRNPLRTIKTDSAFKSTSANVELDSFSANSGEKTPPIEASVSPEIQCGTESKGVVVSAATPVCYGAGHLLSGIRDKRKCRPRGLLIIGEEETNLSGFRKITAIKDYDSKENGDEISPKSRPSFVPPPAEALLRWLSSPNGESDEVQKGYVGTSSPTLKNSCQVLSDFVSDTVFQSERLSSFRGLSGSSDGDFLSPSSQTLGFDEAGCFQMQENRRSSSTWKKSSFSNSSLSCGNVVQTPTSDLSSEKAVCCTDLKLDMDADIPGEASISARIQMPLLNRTDYPSLDRKQRHNKLEECVSWVSDSTLASMSLSRMRISWREGLASQTFNTEDELDCYRCLSDEKNECDKANIWVTSSSPTDLDSVATEKQKPYEGSDLISTTLLKLNSSSVKGKETLFQTGLDVSAESICIDGDSLAASRDSDWTRSYKTDLFQV